jgi:divalent metal cation (Fe/Co/Zn/Cd) transporter
VLLEDLGALVGLVFALTGVTLAKITGEPRWDAAGSLAIGILLAVIAVIAVILVIEMSSLLLGEAAAPEDVALIRAAMIGHPHVTRLIHVRTEHAGPDDIVVAAKIEFASDLTMAQLAASVDEIEGRVRAAVPSARMIFLEPDLYRIVSA